MRLIHAIYWRLRVLLARQMFKIALTLSEAAAKLMPKSKNSAS